MTNLSLNLPSITLPPPCYPVPLNHTTPTTIHLPVYCHSPTVHDNRYPPIAHIQLHYCLPYHPPSATHHTVVLPTILKR
ncbi:BDM_1a_G0000020.mRNA.1.CDS.1 [Saccharomyces cerevisiae]|nr:BDM_1a_G0000020.mRNA.1.CDS.1 [Saccharomyces cerevisiae]CAI7032832.1 BDM_1a_G0000020.mRNA.1.CDS.1 [Saccharomyces cerevisiae]